MALFIPTITWLGDSSDLSPGFDVYLGEPGDVIAGQVLHFEYTVNNGASWVSYLDHTLTVSELVDLTISEAGAMAQGGNLLFRARVESDTEDGDWSNLEPVTLNSHSAGGSERDFYGRFRAKKRRELRLAQEEAKRRAADLSGQPVTEPPAALEEMIVLPNHDPRLDDMVNEIADVMAKIRAQEEDDEEALFALRIH